MNGEHSETARENGKCTVHVQARNKHSSAISYAESVLPLTYIPLFREPLIFASFTSDRKKNPKRICACDGKEYLSLNSMQTFIQTKALPFCHDISLSVYFHAPSHRTNYLLRISHAPHVVGMPHLSVDVLLRSSPAKIGRGTLTELESFIPDQASASLPASRNDKLPNSVPSRHIPQFFVD